MSFLLAICCYHLWEQTETSRYQEQLRSKVLRDLSLVRANAESSINSCVAHVMGVRAFAATYPDLMNNGEDFHRFASSLREGTTGIRSIALCEGTTIRQVWPLEGNESAIGIDLLKIEHQKDAVLRTIHSRKPVLAGPIELVQGGLAFTNRVSIRATPDEGHPCSGKLLGMAAILIDASALLDEMLVGKPDDLIVAIRGKDCLGMEGDFFHGNPEITELSPLTLNITLPSGNWQILGIPKNGWNTVPGSILVYRVIGTLCAVVIGLLVFYIIRSNQIYLKARRDAELAMRAKSHFLSAMSHEIRTPLTSIIGFSTEWCQEAKGEESQEYASIIQRNGLHLLEVINDILNFSKIEADQVRVCKSTFDPHELFQEVFETLLIQAGSKEIEFSIDTGKLKENLLVTDPMRLKQILLNVAGNAIKFTDKGSVSIIATCEQAEDLRHMLRIQIADTGIGMTQKQLDSLYQPFTQGDHSMNRKYGGTGLGMTITRKLVDLLEGTIEVVSKQGQGTVFQIELPIEEPQQIPSDTVEESPNNSMTEKSQSSHPSASPRVLLVEDGIDNQKLLSFLLKKEKFEVTIAEHGLEAINLLKDPAKQDFDVVLMDMQMPIMDGYVATQQIREMGEKIPIIALTAHIADGEEARCLKAGCDAYATKPIDREYLIGLIRNLQQKNKSVPPTSV